MSLPTSTSDMQMESATFTDPQLLAHAKEPISLVSQEHQQKLPSSYLSLSVGDNRNVDLSNEQGSFFYQQPHCNQSVPLKIESGHETGDRVRVMANCKLHEYRKQKSVTPRKHRVGKNSSIHRAKKTANRMVKIKQKRGTVSKRNTNKRKQKGKIYPTSTRQLRSQSKKKKSLNQRLASKEQSVSKVNRNRSLTSNSSVRKLNLTNNRATTSASPSSMVQLTNHSNIASNKIKKQSNIQILNSVSQSNGKQIMNETKHLIPTRSETKSSKASSKKSLRRSKLNVRELPASKSKQTKQRNRHTLKLNIRSPLHTTFKKNVRYNRKRRSTDRKIKYPRCTAKTLSKIYQIYPSPFIIFSDQCKTDHFCDLLKIRDKLSKVTIGPLNESRIKGTDSQKNGIRTKMSTSLFSLRSSLAKRQSAMPLMKNCAQLNSKNNNKRTKKSKR